MLIASKFTFVSVKNFKASSGFVKSSSLISNFPVVGLSFQAEVLAAQIRLLSTLGPNLFTFNQTTTGSYNLVYNMTFDRNAKTVGFQARTNQISITLQEYLMAFPVLMQYANQVAIYK